jgi:hypothetical protein
MAGWAVAFPGLDDSDRRLHTWFRRVEAGRGGDGVFCGHVLYFGDLSEGVVHGILVKRHLGRDGILYQLPALACLGGDMSVEVGSMGG